MEIANWNWESKSEIEKLPVFLIEEPLWKMKSYSKFDYFLYLL